MKKLLGVVLLIVIAFIAWHQFGYSIEQCENGIFATYKKTTVDGGSTYYNLDTKEKVEICTGIWDRGDKEVMCKKIQEQAGMCKKTNPINFLLHKYF